MRYYSALLLSLLSLSRSAPFLGSQPDQPSIPATVQSMEFISHTLYVKDHGHFAPTLMKDPSGVSALTAAHGLSDESDDDAIKFPDDMTVDEMKTRVGDSPLMDVAPEKSYVFSPSYLECTTTR